MDSHPGSTSDWRPPGQQSALQWTDRGRGYGGIRDSLQRHPGTRIRTRIWQWQRSIGKRAWWDISEDDFAQDAKRHVDDENASESANASETDESFQDDLFLDESEIAISTVFQIIC